MLLFMGSVAQASEHLLSLGLGAGGLQSGTTHSGNLMWTWFPDARLLDGLRIGPEARYTRFERSQPLSIGSSKSWEVEKVEIGAANVGFVAEYEMTSALFAGMNLDLFGFSHGPSQNLSGPQNSSADVAAQNTFLFAKSDLGSLNSEFYLRYQLREKSYLRLGLSHQVVQYKAADIATEKLQRFYDLISLNFGYQIF